MKHINAKEAEKNPTLEKTVEPENDLKNMLVEYVGESLNPDNKDVTVEMIVEVTDGHPRKWLPESIAEQLNEGEDILEWDITEIEDESELT